jgi:hypothetical protein
MTRAGVSKQEVTDIFIEIGKGAAAFLSGGIVAYMAEKRKAKMNKVAQEIAMSDYWKKEVQDLKNYTDAKIEMLSTELDHCKKDVVKWMQDKK